MAKEKELRHDESNGDSIDGLIRRFNQRVESILGSKRIPRAEKQAKAEEAMRAVDELMSEIEAGLFPRRDD